MPTLRPRTWLPILALTLGSALPAPARLVANRNYDQLTAEAELVVIAAPTAVRDTAERSELPYTSPGLKAIGVETTFEVSALLKGELPAAAGKPKTLVLHHYRLLASPVAIRNGPSLVTFDPKSGKQYLMFLKWEPDGRCHALSGQTDPDMSIEPLRRQR